MRSEPDVLCFLSSCIISLQETVQCPEMSPSFSAVILPFPCPAHTTARPQPPPLLARAPRVPRTPDITSRPLLLTSPLDSHPSGCRAQPSPDPRPLPDFLPPRGPHQPLSGLLSFWSLVFLSQFIHTQDFSRTSVSVSRVRSYRWSTGYESKVFQQRSGFPNSGDDKALSP